MPDRLLAPAAMATLLCLTTTAVPGQTPGKMSAERNWASIAHCAEEDTERARHVCMDAVLREAGLLTDEMHARQQRRVFGLDEKTARTAAPTATPPAAAATAPAAGAEALNRRAAESTPGAAPAAGVATPPSSTAEALNRRAAESAPGGAADAAPPVPARGAAAAPAQPDRLEVELAKVGKAVDGKIFVTTTDGAVWLQNETVDMPQPPVAGDRMTIRKGSLGGYRCTVASTHLTYRCIRNR